METTQEMELKQIQLKIPTDHYDRIKQYADQNALPITTVVKLAVIFFLEKNATKTLQQQKIVAHT